MTYATIALMGFLATCRAQQNEVSPTTTSHMWSHPLYDLPTKWTSRCRRVNTSHPTTCPCSCVSFPADPTCPACHRRQLDASFNLQALLNFN